MQPQNIKCMLAKTYKCRWEKLRRCKRTFGVDSRPYHIYCATSPSGKRYIGLTSMGVQKRWSAHVRRAETTQNRHPLLDSIRKHGAAAFTLTVLSVERGKTSAQAAEFMWIALLTPELNVSPGGEADGETGAAVFWTSLALDPEKRKVYLETLSQGCKVRSQRSPGLIAALAVKALEWRAKNPRQAWVQSYRAIRCARRAQGHTTKDPRFGKDGRLKIRSARLEALKKSQRSSQTLKAQWASLDQSQRRKSISEAHQSRWAQMDSRTREKHLDQLAAARASIRHTEEVKERRREGIRRYWAEVRARKQLLT